MDYKMENIVISFVFHLNMDFDFV